MSSIASAAFACAGVSTPDATGADATSTAPAPAEVVVGDAAAVLDVETVLDAAADCAGAAAWERRIR